MQFDEVSVRSIPPLENGRRWRLAPKQLSPQRLQVTAGYPPRGRIDYVAPRPIRQTRVPVVHNAQSFGNPALEVQIFGIKKSADTRKALRFFSERRIRTHFVDLMEKPASIGELRRFAQKFGVMSLVDKDSKRFDELGLRYAQLSDERLLTRLSEEPLLLRLPLVRSGNLVMIGADESVWKKWMTG